MSIARLEQDLDEAQETVGFLMRGTRRNLALHRGLVHHPPTRRRSASRGLVGWGPRLDTTDNVQPMNEQENA